MCRGLRVQKPRKASQNRWFDHAPFRLMFDNHGTGKSWLKEEFAESRNFLMKDGERILVGVVPRSSKVDPFTMPEPLPVEESYLLYEETAGERKFRVVSCELGVETRNPEPETRNQILETWNQTANLQLSTCNLKLLPTCT